ncbi:MAG: hypothetical protein Q9188_003681 [Gyalolechia gomerana]
MVYIITISGKKYMVDVGFGGNGATAPVLLAEGNIQERLGKGEMRVIHSNVPQQTDAEQMMWIYQIRPAPDSEWELTYCFTETELLPQDYEMMNFWTSQSRRSIFTCSILMVMDEGRLVGTVTMRDAEAKKRAGNEAVETRTCRSEGERLQVFKEGFGIRLPGIPFTEEEERGIRGTVTELKG